MKKVEMRFTTLFGEEVRNEGSQVYLKLDNGEIAKFHQDQVKDLDMFERFMYLLRDFEEEAGSQIVEGSNATVILKGFKYDVMVTVNLDWSERHVMTTINKEKQSKGEDGFANQREYVSLGALVRNARKFLEK